MTGLATPPDKQLPDATPRNSGRNRLVILLAAAAVVVVAIAVWSPGSSSAPKKTAASTSRSASASPSASAVAPEQPMVINAQGLDWAPPVLVAPKTILISAKNRELVLDDKTDYRLVLPATPVTLIGGLTVTGGHNVVLIGGTIEAPPIADSPQTRRGIYLHDQTGVMHVEGVRLTGPLSEGFDLDERKGGTVQIENVQVDTVLGSQTTNHADVIQTWAGPNVLRIDGLRGSSDYQGFFFLPNQHWESGPAPTLFDIRRTVLTMADPSGYAVWTPATSPWLNADGLTVVDATTDRGRVLWPADQLPSIHVTTPGSAAAVALPPGVPGAGYLSPGYVAPPS
jgi:hypothetical protein